ncbi:MAG: 50S ribosomal protein L10, partial [Methanomassiliicoccales archaeon]
VGPIMAKAYRQAVALSVKAALPMKDNIKILLAKAEANMLALASRAPELADERVKQRLSAKPSPQAAAAPNKPAEAKKEEKKEEKVSEEDAAAGLGQLFG